MSLRNDSLGGLIEDFGLLLTDALVAGWGFPVSILMLGVVIVAGLIVTRRLTARDRASQSTRPDHTRRP